MPRRDSDYERTFGIVGQLRTVVLDASSPALAQEVKADAVCCLVALRKYCRPQLEPNDRVYPALEHRILHALSVITADFGDAPEAPLPRGGLRVHIIRYQNKRHDWPQSAPEKRRICVHVSSEKSR